ncbi:hypothetical protein [Streptomyces sp. WM6378]|nr:hypothetical protein [Streptomyces sp. WM6378]
MAPGALLPWWALTNGRPRVEGSTVEINSRGMLYVGYKQLSGGC